MVINTNVKNLKHNKSKRKQIPKGDSPAQVVSQPNQPSCPSSSERIVPQRKITTVGESNEGCLGGGGGEYPPRGKTEKYHAIDHP